MRAIPKWVEKIHEDNEENEQTGFVIEQPIEFDHNIQRSSNKVPY